MLITGYLNLRTGQILTKQAGYGVLGGHEANPGCPPSEALRLKRGDAPTLRLRVFDPYDDNEACLLASGVVLTASLKIWNDHTTDPLASIADDQWDKPATLTDNVADDLTDDPGGFYLGTLDLAGDDLAALFTAGVSSVYGHLEIQTVTSGIPQSSQSIPVLVLSDVIRPGDGAPAITSQPTASPLLVYKDITSLTGGGATALDGIPTVGKTNVIVMLYVSSEVQTWRLFAGTTAEDAENGIVRPDDYDADDNAQIWKRIA